MDRINQRLQEYLRAKNLSARDFERVTGLGNGTCKKIGESTRSSTFDRISNSDIDLNVDWLLTGEGGMFVERVKAEELPVVNYEKGVPYYDEDFVLGFNELGFPGTENPSFLVYMPKFKNATLWCNATGQSMEPEINNGDVVALQLIEDPSFLVFGEIYAIATTNGLRTIKRLGRGCDDDHYKLVPTNPEYEAQDIPKRMVLRVFKVLGSMHGF